ncbi:MAG TPA: preprotein translocase subunit YajC [Polyangiaceae bacterium]
MSSAALLSQVVPPAPGRQGEVQPDRPATAPGPGPSGPAGEPPGAGGFWLMLALMAPLLLLMFWSSRSQAKKQEKLLAGLTKGDRVLTQSGLAGKYLETTDRFAKIEIAPGVKVDVLRSSILGKDTPETQAAAEKK